MANMEFYTNSVIFTTKVIINGIFLFIFVGLDILSLLQNSTGKLGVAIVPKLRDPTKTFCNLDVFALF